MEKAILELGEDPLTRSKVIKELREKIESWNPSTPKEEALVFNNTESKFLLMFLRARKFNVDDALQLYINYHSFRHKHSNILTDLNPKSVEHVLKSGVIKVLDTRFLDGSKVLCVYPRNWDYNKTPFVENFRTGLLILDRLIQDEETQVHGISVLYDFNGSSLMSMLKVARSELITKGILIELLQESFPVRLKGVHLIQQHWYVNILLSVVRPFMKEKMKNRIYSHGNNFANLHRYVDARNLPMEFGGTLKSDNNNATFRLFEET